MIHIGKLLGAQQSVDEAACILVGDESCRGKDKSAGEGIAIGLIVLVLTQLCVSGSQGKCVGQIIGIGEVDGTTALIGIVKAKDCRTASLPKSLCGGILCSSTQRAARSHCQRGYTYEKYC